MKKLQFGKTGFHVSPLGFGAAPIGYLNTEREKVRKILNLLLDRGVNVIDTAASYEGSAELIRKTVDRSLRRLRTDRLDVMLLHSCDLHTLQKGEAIGALIEAQKGGKIRWAGYSG